jgi:hypothetical protein
VGVLNIINKQQQQFKKCKNIVVNLDIDVQNCINVLLKKPPEVVLTSECPVEVHFLAGISIDLPPDFFYFF